jgi:hypothetical protein
VGLKMINQTFNQAKHTPKRCKLCGRGMPGRKPFRISVKNICDALELYHSVALAAQELGCSRALVYKVLTDHGLRVQDVIRKR